MADSPLVIKLSSSYYMERVERLVRDIRPLVVLDHPIELHVDLEGLAGIGAAGLALLVAAIKRATHRNLLLPGSKLMSPKNPAVRRYVMRMNLLRLLVDDDIDEPFKRNEAVGFRPCVQFIEDTDCHSASRACADALGEMCNIDEETRGSLIICLNEMTENVWYHADAELGGFVVAQGYRNTRWLLRKGRGRGPVLAGRRQPPRAVRPGPGCCGVARASGGCGWR